MGSKRRRWSSQADGAANVEKEMRFGSAAAEFTQPLTRGRQGPGARGFSLLETMLVVAISLVAIAVTVMSVQPTLQSARATSAFNQCFMVLRRYRQQAIDERKQYVVTFVAPNTIQVWRQDVATPVNPAPVLISTQTLSSPDIQFQVVPGVPTANTPDNFGNASRAIDFGQAIGLGGLNYVKFMPDGSSQDVNGNLNSGVLYVAINNNLYSSRAITVFGATGRIRGWQLVKQNGNATWVQR
jgi:prepilin-type N-terminal cleavage/methylation domain-containing protein